MADLFSYIYHNASVTQIDSASQEDHVTRLYIACHAEAIECIGKFYRNTDIIVVEKNIFCIRNKAI